MRTLPNDIINLIFSYVSSPTNLIMKDYIDSNINEYNDYVLFNDRLEMNNYTKSFGCYKLSIKTKNLNIFNKYDIVVYHLKNIIVKRYYESFGGHIISFKHKHPRMIGNTLNEKFE